MSILDDDGKTETGEGGGMAVWKPPPPPPPTAQLLGILFALLALGAVFFRSWGFCMAFMALSVVFDVWAFAQVRAWSARAAEAKAAAEAAAATGRRRAG